MIEQSMVKRVRKERLTPSKSAIRKAKTLLGEARQQLYHEHLPFKISFSMRPLLEQWIASLDVDNEYHQMIRTSIEDYIAKHPNLLQPYHSLEDFLEEHDNSQLDFLFGSVFPPALSRQVLGYVAPAFSFEPFYITWGMFQLLDNTDAEIEVEQYSIFQNIPFSVRACFIILNKVYGLDLDYVMPYIFKVKFGKTAPRQYFKVANILDFLEVKTHRPPPHISQEQIDFLLKNPKDVDLWMSIFSPETFHFEGLFVSTMTEVTDLEAMSRLRRRLLQQDSLLSDRGIRLIEGLTNIYLKLNDSKLGIQALDYPTRKSRAGQYEIGRALVPEAGHPLGPDNVGSFYEQACAENHIKIISDLRSIKNPTPIEQALITKGFRSLMLVPLRKKGQEIIGLIELASKQSYAYTYVNSLKIKEILPLFDASMEDNRSFIESKIRNTIQTHFTHIHPSLMWKFEESAANFLRAGEDVRQMKPPVFKDLHALYGQIDINGSTTIRNEAIRYDLITNLGEVKTILEGVLGKTKIDLLRKWIYEVSDQIDVLQEDYTTHAESNAVNLIREVNILLRKVADEDPTANEVWIKEYLDRLDPELDVLNSARWQFEQSVRKINRTISRYLAKEEQKNQKVLPHFFDKFQTDGIEYNLYVGQSLLESGTFAQHHLQNLRLWQLKSMVEIKRGLSSQRGELPIDLTLSYLIFVYDSTISIRFRSDEKRFDVEGTQDIRYEVLKKRLDKALLYESEERLTADGKLAIVFIQERDMLGYRQYINYLIREGYLEEEVEEVQIEPLQGAVGLKALRVIPIL